MSQNEPTEDKPRRVFEPLETPLIFMDREGIIRRIGTCVLQPDGSALCTVTENEGDRVMEALFKMGVPFQMNSLIRNVDIPSKSG